MNSCINRNPRLGSHNADKAMSLQPTQIEKKPVSHPGSGPGQSQGQGRNPTRPMKDVSVVYPADYTGERIDLDEVGFYDIIPRHMQADLGDIWFDSDCDCDEEEEEEEDDGPLYDCRICGRRVRHGSPFCPYLKFVPHNAYLPPGIQRICTCCGKRDGHPGEKWKACAIYKECLNCGTYAQHWTEDPNCPTNARKDKYACTSVHKKPS